MAPLALATRTGLRRLAADVRPLVQAVHVRFFAAPAGDADADPILTLFRENQRQYRELLKGMQNIPFPLSGESGAVTAYKDKVEALRAQVGARTVEEEVRDGLAASSLRPKNLDELQALLDSEDPALLPAQEAYDAWEEDVEAWLTGFEKRYAGAIPDDAATDAAEAEVDWAGKAAPKRKELSPAEIEFWSKAKEWKIRLGRIADLIPYDPAAATAQPSEAEVKAVVQAEYQKLADEARATVTEDLAKADSIANTGAATLPAEVKPQLS